MEEEPRGDEVLGQEPPSRRRMAVVAGLVAALLAPSLVVLAGALGLRLPSSHRPSPAATPNAGAVASRPIPIFPRVLASPAVEAPNYGPVPPGVPVFFGYQRNYPDRLIAYSWAGRPVGTLVLDPGQAFAASQSPDGEYISVVGTILSRAGAQVGAWPAGEAGTPTWAPDSRHLCGIRVLGDVNVRWRNVLWTSAVGAPPRDVGVVGSGEDGMSPVGDSVLACSYRRNLAVVARRSYTWITDIWYVRLSDGGVLGHQAYRSQYMANVAVDPDATYIAENAHPGGALETLVRRIDDGSVVDRLGTAMVLAIRGNHLVESDGRVQVVGLDGMPLEAEFSIDWTFLGALQQPGSDQMLLSFATLGDTGPARLMLLGADFETFLPGDLLMPLS